MMVMVALTGHDLSSGTSRRGGGARDCCCPCLACGLRARWSRQVGFRGLGGEDVQPSGAEGPLPEKVMGIMAAFGLRNADRWRRRGDFRCPRGEDVRSRSKGRFPKRYVDDDVAAEGENDWESWMRLELERGRGVEAGRGRQHSRGGWPVIPV